MLFPLPFFLQLTFLELKNLVPGSLPAGGSAGPLVPWAWRMIWIGSSSPCPFCALPRHAVRVFPGAGAHFIHACTLELCKHVTT